MSRAPLAHALVLVCSACMLAAFARDASAQASMTISADSDSRFRGVSLGGNHPSVRAELAYDGAHGWYAGASAARAEFAAGDRYALLTAYAGRAVPLTSSIDVDAGASGWAFSGGSFDFVEAYVGIVAPSWSLRVNGSPDYFGRHTATLYLDASAHRLLSDTVRVFVHAGGLLASSSRPHASAYPSPYAQPARAKRVRWDLRAGIGWNVSANVDLQLAWVTTSAGGPFPAPQPGRRSGWTANASYSF